MSVRETAYLEKFAKIVRRTCVRGLTPNKKTQPARYKKEQDGGKSFCSKRSRITAGNTKESNANPQRGMKRKIMKSSKVPRSQ